MPEQLQQQIATKLHPMNDTFDMSGEISVVATEIEKLEARVLWLQMLQKGLKLLQQKGVSAVVNELNGMRDALLRSSQHFSQQKHLKFVRAISAYNSIITGLMD